MDDTICPWATKIIYLKILLEGEPAEEVVDDQLTGIHLNDYNTVIKQLFLKFTKDQTSHIGVIAKAQALTVTDYSKESIAL
jgi:hypothetical protein